MEVPYKTIQAGKGSDPPPTTWAMRKCFEHHFIRGFPYRQSTPRPDLISSADIAAAAVTAFLDHIITEAVCN